jgi:hypothetical protein
MNENGWAQQLKNIEPCRRDSGVAGATRQDHAMVFTTVGTKPGWHSLRGFRMGARRSLS